jgi:zinc protease
MIGTALQSHPYGHETIGYREDIEGYTTAMLDVFYKKYYAPNNATLIIAGDVDEASMCASVVAHFASIKPSKTLTSRKIIKEPKQTGMRTVLVKKPSTTNVLGIGVRHDGFPSKGWIETSVLFSILVGGTDSILHKKLVDTAEAISVEGGLEPTYDANIGIIYITLAPGVSHEVMYLHVREILDAITIHDVSPYLKKIIAQNITSECTNRESSYGLVMELIEYVSADAWERFFDTEKLLHSITAKDIIARIKQIYAEDVITIGKYIGTK